MSLENMQNHSEQLTQTDSLADLTDSPVASQKFDDYRTERTPQISVQSRTSTQDTIEKLFGTPVVDSRKGQRNDTAAEADSATPKKDSKEPSQGKQISWDDFAPTLPGTSQPKKADGNSEKKDPKDSSPSPTDRPSKPGESPAKPEAPDTKSDTRENLRAPDLKQAFEQIRLTATPDLSKTRITADSMKQLVEMVKDKKPHVNQLVLKGCQIEDGAYPN